MRTLSKFLAPVVSMSLGACNGAQDVPAQQPTAASPPKTDELPAFVGRVWMSTTRGHAPGTILVFLPDKTVLRDSCMERFRVSQWGVISESRIRWIEDTIPIEAEYSQPSSRELLLEPVGTGRQETYVTISVPYVCPRSG